MITLTRGPGADARDLDWLCVKCMGGGFPSGLGRRNHFDGSMATPGGFTVAGIPKFNPAQLSRKARSG
jgi:hypothetical protein